MGPFHILLDEMGLDKEGIHQIPYVARLSLRRRVWPVRRVRVWPTRLRLLVERESLVHWPVLTQLELGWVISAFIATAFTMLHMSLYMVFMEHASQESRTVFSIAVCKYRLVSATLSPHKEKSNVLNRVCPPKVGHLLDIWNWAITITFCVLWLS